MIYRLSLQKVLLHRQVNWLTLKILLNLLIERNLTIILRTITILDLRLTELLLLIKLVKLGIDLVAELHELLLTKLLVNERLLVKWLLGLPLVNVDCLCKS